MEKGKRKKLRRTKSNKASTLGYSLAEHLKGTSAFDSDRKESKAQGSLDKTFFYWTKLFVGIFSGAMLAAELYALLGMIDKGQWDGGGFLKIPHDNLTFFVFIAGGVGGYFISSLASSKDSNEKNR